MGNLTNSQKSIWVTEQYYKGSSVNNICGYAIIEEQIDLDKLKKAIQIVCQKHDNFWLQLKIEDGEVKQFLSERKEVEIVSINVANPDELEEKIQEIVKIPFKLEESELFKFYIYKFENGQGGYMPKVHHLIGDGWTMALISNEIIKTYSQLKQNQDTDEMPIYSYIDYMKSEQEYLESEKYQKDKKYWEDKFTQIPEVATIPGSKINGDESNPEGNREKYKLDLTLVENIKKYCKENKISLYNFFMAIYAIYIGEISNLDEFVIGTPILNRTNFKEKSAMGMFINMVPFKINMNQNDDFQTFVKNIAIESMGMLKHQKYSYQSLLENLREKNKNIPSLYNILLSYQITNTHQNGGDMIYKNDWAFNGCCAENMDIQISDFNDTGSLDISYDYKISIYEQKDIENLHKRILYIIQQVISKEEIELKDIEIVTLEEKNKLVNEFNRTELEYDSNIPIIKYFEEQAEKTPDSIAIVFENTKMTYKELNEKANSLAHELRKNGVKNNTIVGIMQERSFEMLIAILAVLKSGGAYIPIAPDYPAERVEYMLKDSNAGILLSETNKIKTDKQIISINLNNKIYEENKENLENISKPEDLSYLIYTSGSTGTPKGVMLKQQNLTNFYNAMLQNIEYLNKKEPLKIISITTLSFDIFIFETLMSLTRGLIVYMTNENEQKITEKLEQKINDNEIQAIQTTPSVMKFHLDNIRNKENLKSLKYIMLAGEPLSKTLVDRIKEMIPNVTVYNGYGPSETTIFSTTRNVTNLEEITIGRPIANTQIYVLNKNKKLLPQGNIGEIYIAGDGVGKGYINKKEQSESNFIPNIFIENSIMYKTGDLGAFEENGEIKCYGRVDNQIKIRGLRIELPEIEKQMLSIKNIQDVVVVKKNINGRDVLCAYHTESGLVDKKSMKKILQDKLPQYMMPQYFVKLDEMPYTPNGKIDRKLLPIPNITEKVKEKIQIRNDIDKELIQIVQKMLNIDNINLSDTLLELGGDSLTAITLTTKISSRFDVQLNLKDIMSNKTLKEISDIIMERQSKGCTKIKIEKALEQEYYPLSSAQKRIYYNSKMIGEENLVYNMPGGILVNEILNIEKVKSVFKKIIERHSILRTSFILQNNNVMQKISGNINLEIPVYYNTESEIEDILKNFSRPFKLEKDLLFRVELHYIDGNKTLLLVESHHAIMDGTSLNNLIIEFERLYNGQNLKKIPIQYKDYATWENKFNESETIVKYEEYWINKLKDAELSQLNLPYDYKIPINRSYKGNKISKTIDENQFREIEKFAKKVGVSPYMFFISTFLILLYKYTGQEEIILGSPISNRDLNETKRMLGMFVNNIVLKGNIKAERTFQQFLDEIKEQVLNDISNQPYPFDMLVKKLGIKTDNSRNPIFDVMFTYQNKEENVLELEGHKSEILEIDNKISKFNLSLEIKPKTHTINIEYCTDLFKKQTIERLFEHYINVISTVVDNKNVKISDISIISEEEKNKILYYFNNTNAEYPKNKTVIQLFEEQVEKAPDNIAVVFEGTKLTYRELNEKANQLANSIKKQHISSEDVIAILLDKSLEMIVAILAILKNGCTYLPIDIGYPKERMEYIIKDANAKLLLTSRDLNLETGLLVKSLYIDLDAESLYDIEEKNNLDYKGKSSDLAYIMYTSGSTGKPKGVMIENKSIIRLVKNTNYIQFKKDDKILQTGSIVFDACTLEIWGALLNGLELYIIRKEELLDASLLHTYILKNNISVLWLTAPLFNQLCEEIPHLFKTVRCVLSGGDVLSCKHVNMVKTANPDLQIINGYGPTENTTFSCCHNIEKKYKESIPIGKPIANSTGYIVSKDGNLQPIGISGELWVGGDGVARGYVNNIDLTAQKFINNPFGSGKIYKTGDLTKWNNDGTIEFLGRIDSQIKIRGFRVELSEITTIVSQYEGIKEAYTVFKDVQKEKAICTYIVGKTEIDITNLKDFLNTFLPQYMIPKYIVQLKKLPKNQNGKIDKNALPEIKIQNEKNREILLPKNKTEELVYNIFKTILNVEELSTDDNFFEYGGDSISAMRLQVEALRNNLNITYGDIFKYPTVQLIAQYLDSTNLITEEKEENGYYQYDDLIKNNKLEILEKEEIVQTPIGNVLLTGVTGFLGAHLLDSYLKQETGIIYCLIRGKNHTPAIERLQNILHFYFKDKYDKEIGARIRCVEGDISLEQLGIGNKEYKAIGENVTTVIHSAALVKHFGNLKEFEEINVNGTKRIVEFCKQFGIRLMHISTISVSGNNFAEGAYIENKIEDEINYGEDKFYIGQNLENLYVNSKFLAEKVVLDAISKGLEAYILRMGNLTSRFSEGKFQQNHLENAFVNRVKTFLQLGCAPDYMMSGYAEFTPIDYSADAIIKIANHYDKKFTIMHLLNDKHLLLPKFCNILHELGVKLNVVTNEEFKNLIDYMLQDENKLTILQGIMRDFNTEKKLVYESNIKIKSDFTREFLRRIDFEWPDIDKKYIKKYLEYLIQIGYLNINLREE